MRRKLNFNIFYCLKEFTSRRAAQTNQQNIKEQKPEIHHLSTSPTRDIPLAKLL